MKLQAITSHFKTFPVSSRDQLLTRFAGGDERHVRKLNGKLRKLVDRGQLEVNKEILPYVYFSVPRRIHKRSAHLNHHLAVVDFYLKLEETYRRKQMAIPQVLHLEYPFGKGYPRPDIILKEGNRTVMVEIQRTLISNKQMQMKIDEYEKLHVDGKYKEVSEPDQPFMVWIVGTRKYEIETRLPLRYTVMNM